MCRTRIYILGGTAVCDTRRVWCTDIIRLMKKNLLEINFAVGYAQLK